MATPADPILPVVTVLNAIATPTSSGPGPTGYENASATGTPVALTIAALLQVIYSSSGDMKTVGTGIQTALTDVAQVIGVIAGGLAALPALPASGSAALTDIVQNALTLAQHSRRRAPSRLGRRVNSLRHCSNC